MIKKVPRTENCNVTHLDMLTASYAIPGSSENSTVKEYVPLSLTPTAGTISAGRDLKDKSSHTMLGPLSQAKKSINQNSREQVKDIIHDARKHCGTVGRASLRTCEFPASKNRPAATPKLSHTNSNFVLSKVTLSRGGPRKRNLSFCFPHLFREAWKKK